jgi:hypothetical protein
MSGTFGLIRMECFPWACTSMGGRVKGRQQAAEGAGPGPGREDHDGGLSPFLASFPDWVPRIEAPRHPKFHRK